MINKMWIIRILLVLIIESTIASCCSNGQISESDLIKIESVNINYADYEVEIDECLPLGYFTVTTKNENYDTITLNNLYFEIIETGIEAEKMKFCNPQGKLIFVQYSIIDKGSSEAKVFRLLPEDL